MERKKYKKLTPARLSQARFLRERGCTLDAIAEHLGVHRVALVEALPEGGFRRLSDGAVRQIRALRREGESYGAIARRYDITLSYVRLICVGKRRSTVPDEEGVAAAPAPAADDWRPIAGFDGAYRVSRRGEVESRRNAHGTCAHWRRLTSSFDLRHRGARVYHSLVPASGKLQTHCYLAQVVLETFGPPKPHPESKPQHKDGDPRNCHIDNLYWSSRYPTPAEVLAKPKLKPEPKKKEPKPKPGDKKKELLRLIGELIAVL